MNSFFSSRWIEPLAHVSELDGGGLPAGFRAAGVAAGIKEGGASDVGLLVCDALERTPTFPVRDVVPDMLESLQIDVTASRQVPIYRTMLEPLRRRGRGDRHLVHVIAVVALLDLLSRIAWPCSIECAPPQCESPLSV